MVTMSLLANFSDSNLDRLKCPYSMNTQPNQMTRYDVRCGQAPWENTTTDLDSAIDLAYHLSEDYQCDVNIHYNHTGTIYTTVSNY
jgi:hypothetical protein